jgi:hypothetical protein
MVSFGEFLNRIDLNTWGNMLIGVAVAALTTIISLVVTHRNKSGIITVLIVIMCATTLTGGFLLFKESNKPKTADKQSPLDTSRSSNFPMPQVPDMTPGCWD